MTKSYRVFTGAPAASDVQQDPHSYRWRTVSSAQPPVLYSLPPATFEAASRRISLLYQNIIFKDAEEDPQDLQEADHSDHFQNQTTVITWPPTAQDTGVSILRPSLSLSRVRSQPVGTQETQDSGSYNYSDASSIARFPAFHFNLHTVTSLSALTAQVQRTSALQKGSRKITILAAVLEVEGPDTIRIKKGAEAGKEVSLLKVIVGDEEGAVCKLTAWREVAEAWGGADPDVPTGIKRGDVALFEDVLASWAAGPTHAGPDASSVAQILLTASTGLKSKCEICYRTMPYMPGDSRFRPDLRLGFSDAAVRKVADVVSWFEHVAGLPEN